MPESAARNDVFYGAHDLARRRISQAIVEVTRMLDACESNLTGDRLVEVRDLLRDAERGLRSV